MNPEEKSKQCQDKHYLRFLLKNVKKRLEKSPELKEVR
jgi:hypothetical protein